MRIPIAYITGNSMGAIVGGLYASGFTPDEIERELKAMDWDDLFADARRAPTARSGASATTTCTSSARASASAMGACISRSPSSRARSSTCTSTGSPRTWRA